MDGVIDPSLSFWVLVVCMYHWLWVLQACYKASQHWALTPCRRCQGVLVVRTATWWWGRAGLLGQSRIRAWREWRWQQPLCFLIGWAAQHRPPWLFSGSISSTGLRRPIAAGCSLPGVREKTHPGLKETSFSFWALIGSSSNHFCSAGPMGTRKLFLKKICFIVVFSCLLFLDEGEQLPIWGLFFQLATNFYQGLVLNLMRAKGVTSVALLHQELKCSRSPRAWSEGTQYYKLAETKHFLTVRASRKLSYATLSAMEELQYLNCRCWLRR